MEDQIESIFTVFFEKDLLFQFALMLDEENNLVNSFVSLRNLIEINGIPDDVKLVIHAHEKPMPEHVRKCNILEASEVAASVFGEQHRKLDIVLRPRCESDVNGSEKPDFINLGNRMDDPLAYPLLFPHRNYECHCELKHIDSKGKLRNFSPLKSYSRLLFQRTCDFNVLLYSGRLFQQYLCEMFVKVESERLSWLRHNQSKLRVSYYLRLCELLAYASINKSEVNEWNGHKNQDCDLNVGRLLVLPSTYIESDRYMRQKMYDIIVDSNSIGHHDIFVTMTCNSY